MSSIARVGAARQIVNDREGLEEIFACLWVIRIVLYIVQARGSSLAIDGQG
jgi:hypothetical protein